MSSGEQRVSLPGGAHLHLQGHLHGQRIPFKPAAAPQGASPCLYLMCLLSPLLVAPPVKGKRKQSEGGDPLDPPVSPQPDGEHSRSQSPIQLEVSWETPWGPFQVNMEIPSSQEGGVFPPPTCRARSRAWPESWALHWEVWELARQEDSPSPGQGCQTSLS